MTIQFLGASETVTGSKYLLNTGDKKILIDCGLFQGLKELRLLNWNDLPLDVSDIDAVILTHGHLDHTGYLPRLLKLGFKGHIYGTPPTLDIAEIILLDSGKIQEEESKKANDEGYSKHHPAKPLYNLKDAERAIAHFRVMQEGEWIELFPNIKVRLQYNGHILGAVFIEMDVQGKRIVFSGDIGRKKDALLHSPKKPEKADVLLIESTYGDRIHPQIDLEKRMQEIVMHTIEKNGTLIIPSFAVERAQLLMYVLWKLREKKLIPEIPMILDSPMGANVLQLFYKYKEWHQLEIDDCIKMCEAFQIVREYKETWENIDNDKPKIVIAGSGMVTGGRVLTYLQYYLDRPETSILLAGYQAEGTRGRALLEGTKELKIYGKYYPVQAEVFDLQVLSAHADQNELLDWMREIKEAPKHIFVVHGESIAADAFRMKIKDTYGWEARIPELNEIVEI